jgi:hypothetical protein
MKNDITRRDAFVMAVSAAALAAAAAQAQAPGADLTVIIAFR